MSKQRSGTLELLSDRTKPYIFKHLVIRHCGQSNEPNISLGPKRILCAHLQYEP